jgi:prefoldin subunit 5
MASGRPVIVQDTGLANILPLGKGVFAFNNLEDAVESVKEVNKDYQAQCRYARATAEELFGSEQVLGHLIDRAS